MPMQLIAMNSHSRVKPVPVNKPGRVIHHAQQSQLIPHPHAACASKSQQLILPATPCNYPMTHKTQM